MPVTLTGPNAFQDLNDRHIQRFSDMNRYVIARLAQAVGAMQTDLVTLHSAMPSGPGRVTALRQADHPFARRHGSPLWPTPPVGQVSGLLASSLRVTTSVPSLNVYELTGKSVGVDYAQYIYSPFGTAKMLPRGMLDAAFKFTETRAIQLGKDVMAYQLRLL